MFLGARRGRLPPSRQHVAERARITKHGKVLPWTSLPPPSTVVREALAECAITECALNRRPGEAAVSRPRYASPDSVADSLEAVVLED